MTDSLSRVALFITGFTIGFLVTYGACEVVRRWWQQR